MRKKGQIWIETVIYTLIGLSMIGLVLAIVTPRVNEYRDRTIIDQTIESLNEFDKKINDVLSAPGNKRKVEFRMRRGDLYIDTENDKILYVLENSRSLYSEPGTTISIGRINVTTIESEKNYEITLVLGYDQNITFNNVDSSEVVKLSAASIPYIFLIDNKGFQDPGVYQIDISEA